MAIKKPSSNLQKVLESLPLWDDHAFRHEFPNLYEFLTEIKYAEGEPRIPGTMSVFCKNGVLTLCLNDNDNKRSLFINAPTFTEALAFADMSVCDDSADWKAKRPAAPGEKIPF